MASGREPTRSGKGTQLASPDPEFTVLASTFSAGWDNVRGLIVEGRLTEFYRHSSPLHFLVFVLSGTTRVERKRGERFTRTLCEPGALAILAAGDEQQFRTERRTRVLVWMIDPTRLQSIAAQEWDPTESTVELVESFNSRDAEFWSLGHRLASQILTPIPGSRLCAEALNTQLALHLLWNYSSLPRPHQAEVQRLADPRLRRVIDYMQSSLGNEISLAALAELAGLSPNYFLNAFRKATGRTPHQYLTEQRIARACELLHNPHRSIVDVSLSVGFSSQSHLTTVFRRFLKTTPAAYRQEVLGLRPLSAPGVPGALG